MALSRTATATILPYRGYGAFISSSMQNPAATPEQALEFALKVLLFHYEDAIEKGHTPSAKWFSRTPGFDA
jgi:hypothetical protein